MADQDDYDEDRHPAHREFCEVLRKIDFPSRYYAYCEAHGKKDRPDVPLALQTKALDETGKTFRYDKKEKFFGWRDSNAPKGCELGINLVLEFAQADWILVFGTPSGHLAGSFSGMALDAIRMVDPAYQREPRYPTPKIANAKELRVVLAEGFALYEDVAKALRSRDWK